MLQLASALVDEELIAKVADAPPMVRVRGGERCVFVQNPQVPGWNADIVLHESIAATGATLWWFFSWNELIGPASDLYGAVNRIKARMTPRPADLPLSEGVRLIEARLLSRDAPLGREG